jgi:hypothetical protein
MPSTLDRKRWEIRCRNYSKGYRSVACVALLDRLSSSDVSATEASNRMLSSLPSPPLQPHIVDFTNTAETDDHETQHEDGRKAEKEGKDDDDEMEDDFESPQDRVELSQHLRSSEVASDKLYNSNGENLLATEGRNDMEKPSGKKFRTASFDTDSDTSFVDSNYEPEAEDQTIPVYRNYETGRYSTTEYDPNEDPGMSLELEIPGEEILVTPEMLERAEALCAEQDDADLLAVSAVLTYERAWPEVTQRAIGIGRLSPLGFASLAREYIAASNRHIDNHLLYWKHQQELIKQADQDLKEAILKVQRDNQLLAEIKGETVDMAERLAADQQKDLMASRLATVPESQYHQRPSVTPSIRSKLDFKPGHLSRTGFNDNGRGLFGNLHAASMRGARGFTTPNRRVPPATRTPRMATPISSHSQLGPQQSPGSPATTGTSTATIPSVATIQTAATPPIHGQAAASGTPTPTASDVKLRETMGL